MKIVVRGYTRKNGTAGWKAHDTEDGEKIVAQCRHAFEDKEVAENVGNATMAWMGSTKILEAEREIANLLNRESELQQVNKDLRSEMSGASAALTESQTAVQELEGRTRDQAHRIANLEEELSIVRTTNVDLRAREKDYRDTIQRVGKDLEASGNKLGEAQQGLQYQTEQNAAKMREIESLRGANKLNIEGRQKAERDVESLRSQKVSLAKKLTEAEARANRWFNDTRAVAIAFTVAFGSIVVAAYCLLRGAFN